MIKCEWEKTTQPLFSVISRWSSIDVILHTHRDMWQHLESLLIVPSGGGGKVATGIEWVEAGDAAQHPSMHRTAPLPPTQRIIQPRCRRHRMNRHSSGWSRRSWVWFWFCLMCFGVVLQASNSLVLLLLPTCCVTLSSPLSLSGPHFSSLRSW